MRRFSLVVDRSSSDLGSSSDLETMLLSEIGRINFHTSNYPVIQSVALNFKNGDMVTSFSTVFLEKVYGTLIEPAREFGYYYGNMPKSQRCKQICKPSASQHNGDDEKFSAACVAILCAIDEERARRELLCPDRIPMQ